MAIRENVRCAQGHSVIYIAAMTDEKKAARNAYMREWRLRNLDRERARDRERQPSRNATARARWLNDPEFRAARLARARQWKKENPDHIRALKRGYYFRERAKSWIAGLRNQCRRQEIPFDLTVEWLKERLDRGVCELSGLPFEREPRRGPNSPSIDRVVPGGPYTQANCRVVLWSINRALNNYGEDYMIRVFAAVIAKRAQK